MHFVRFIAIQLLMNCWVSCYDIFVSYRPCIKLFLVSLFYNYIGLYILFLLSCSSIYGFSFYNPFYILCLSHTNCFCCLLRESILGVLICILWLFLCIGHYCTLPFALYRFTLFCLVLLS